MTSPNNRGRTLNQARLAEFKEKFFAHTRHGQQLVDYLTRSGCGIWRYEADPFDSRRWWLNITLSSYVAEMFDAHLEIQLVYVEFERVEPRLFELVQQRIRKDARVDPGLFIVASLDPEVARLARRRRGEFAVIDLLLGALEPDVPEIRLRMSEILTSVDHFDITAPIKDPSGFFGRKAEYDRMISAIERGQSVGVFGLRKTGKTSLLNYVIGRRQESGRSVVKIDISGLSGADDFKRRTVEGAVKAVRDSDSRPLPRLRTLTATGEPKGGADSLRSYWLRDVESITEHCGRLEIFIDEIDQAYPPRSYLGIEEATQILIALTQLRGMIQSADPDSGIVLVCAGTDPALFERPLLSTGADNLLYKVVRLMFLSPMSREEMAEMVRDLARRMGIRIRDHQVVDFLYDEYGGHPLLSRKACSVATMVRPPGEVPWHMPLDAVVRAADARGDGTPFQQAGEILESYTEWFPDEADVLRALWSPDFDERELARLIIEEDGDRVRHAVPYGLLIPDATKARVRAVERFVNATGS
ncbi:MAG: hypothetical protein HYZ39_04830 [Mycolicibacterium cosmeticum]|nr:hypothetical protein [Mycolicibacterium cosmeticum]